MTSSLTSNQQVKWTPNERGKRPKELGWYLVAICGSKSYMPMVSIAWWDSGWMNIANYVHRDERMKIIYWAPLPRMPKRLQQRVDRNLK